jgi:formylglycine-generating enzyme required for sulfatase activity
LGFGGELAAFPFCVGERVFVGDGDDGEIFAACDGGLWSAGVAPVRAFDVAPPGGGPDTSIEGRGEFPVVALAYEDIEAYAKWKGRALPSEAQWEWAARAGAPHTDDHPQPKDANTWQGVFPLINTNEDGFAGVAPVGCFKPNAYGLYDMIGNVWEWTADEFKGHAPKARVIKGGSYLCAPNYCLRYRPAARQPQEEDLGTSHLGFRTVLNAPGPH